MNPKLFGRTLWIIMFEYLFKYQDDIEKIKSFYWLISNIIPCSKCSIHFKESMTINNIMSSTDWNYIKEYTIWLYNTMHSEQIIFSK